MIPQRNKYSLICQYVCFFFKYLIYNFRIWFNLRLIPPILGQSHHPKLISYFWLWNGYYYLLKETKQNQFLQVILGTARHTWAHLDMWRHLSMALYRHGQPKTVRLFWPIKRLNCSCLFPNRHLWDCGFLLWHAF